MPVVDFVGLAAMRGLVNIIIGVVFIVGGLSGKMALRGTNSSGGIAVVGGVLVLVGLYRMTRTE